MSDTWIGGNILFHYTLKDILLYGFQVLYFILCTYLTGTTLGKRAMNLRVVSADGQKLTILNIVYRETIGRFLCSLSVGIGYIIAGVDREKRGLHDILCDTRVIYAKRVKVIPVYPRYQAPPMPGQPMPGQPMPGPGQTVVPPMPGYPPQNTQPPRVEQPDTAGEENRRDS